MDNIDLGSRFSQHLSVPIWHTLSPTLTFSALGLGCSFLGCPFPIESSHLQNITKRLHGLCIHSLPSWPLGLTLASPISSPNIHCSLVPKKIVHCEIQFMQPFLGGGVPLGPTYSRMHTTIFYHFSCLLPSSVWTMMHAPSLLSKFQSAMET